MNSAFKIVLSLIVSLCLNSHLKAQQSGASQSDEVKAKQILEAMSAFDKGNYKDSIPILKSAASEDIFWAVDYLGRAYEEGKAFPQNYEMAFKYYKCSADNGYYPGMFKTAYFYSEGLGVRQDYQESYFWLLLAIPNYKGEMQAQLIGLRNMISKKLNSEQVVNLQKKAQVWKPIRKKCDF